MLQSVYILRTFAPHLTVISRSELEDIKPQFGALAMAAAAVCRFYLTYSAFPSCCSQVEVAFNCFKHTGYFDPPEGDFEKIKGASLSMKWVNGAVASLYNKQSRWNSMMTAATRQSEIRVGRSRRRVANKAMDSHDRDMVPDSSSPARPE